MRSLILAAALALSACTAGTTTATNPVAVGDTVVVSATDGLSYAADAYAAAASVLTVAIKNGALSDEQLRMVRGLNNHALSLLNGADTTLTQAQRAASVLLAVKQMRSILGR
jgi:hypothetical protein